ncbi:MAG: RNA polymerase sigma factor RpoD/SigA [Planctomycetes bacterium]|nr:RNA polymerase sigma factor RpoD/SigA [Planctomycetota bacterium]
MTATAANQELDIYFRQIDGELLTDEQERELGWKIIRHDDPKARERMICGNLRLVVCIAKQFVNRGLSLAELIAEGNVGLLRAVESFDPEQGVRFSTYAAWWIRQPMKHALINAAQPLHVPPYMADRIVRWKRANRQFKERLGREPSISELSGLMRLVPRKVRTVHYAARTLRRPTQGSAGNEPVPGQNLHDRRMPMPDERASNADDAQRIRGLLDGIDGRQASVLRLHYGLDGAGQMTFQEIATQLGVTRQRVQQLEAMAFRTLKWRLLRDRRLSASWVLHRGETPSDKMSQCAPAGSEHAAEAWRGNMAMSQS